MEEVKRRMENAFTAPMELFPQEKGWYYAPVPSALSVPLEHLAERGLIAVTAKIGTSEWPTSLLPMGDGTHFIPLPAKVRKKEKLALGQPVEVAFAVRARNAP